MSDYIEFNTLTPNPNFADVNDVSCEETLNKKNQVLLVDVREPDEFHGELGHIEGSQLMPLASVPKQIHDLPKNKTIVLICRSGNRSGQAAAFMKEQGFSSVYNMKGGMLEWNAKNLEIQQ